MFNKTILSILSVILILCLSACSANKSVSKKSAEPDLLESFVAIMEVKEPIKGVCNNNKVYSNSNSF